MKQKNKFKNIEKGIIKVAWVGKSNKVLYSKMFNSIPEALKFSKNKKLCLIFKLIKRKGMEFHWKILNYKTAKRVYKLIQYEKDLEKIYFIKNKIQNYKKDII